MTRHTKSLLMLLVILFASAIHAANGFAQDARMRQLSGHLTAAEQYQKQSKHREAANSYRQARLIATQVFGENSIYVAAMLQAEGTMVRQSGDFKQAETLFTQTLKISESLGDRELTAESANNLAAVYWELGRFAESLAMHEKAFEMFKVIYGEQSAELAVSRGNLAGVHKSLGQEAKAETLYLESIAVLEKHSRKHALELADGLMNLAEVYSSRGDFNRAELLLLRSISIKEQTLGDRHFEVARTQNNLAALYGAMGQYAKSEQLHLENIELLELSLGKDHLDTSRSLINLANMYMRQQQFDKALPLLQRAIEIREKIFDANHPDVALAKHVLADAYTDHGDYDQALPLYTAALKSREKSYGVDHPHVARSLLSIGHVNYLNGEYDTAQQHLDRSLEIRQAKLGAEHPDLAYTHNAMARISAARKDWAKSSAQYDLARRGFRRYIGQVLPALSEVDQLTFLREVDEENYQSALSLIAYSPEDQDVIDRTAGWVLNGKGISQQALAQRAILARDTSDPVLAAIAQGLLAVRKQLASLSLIESESEDAQARQRRIAELSKQEKEQAAALARIGGRPTASEWVELAAVRDAIPKGAVLVEIARFRIYDFQHLQAPKDELKERYFAWIIPSSGDGEVKAIDLGDAKHVDETVNMLREAISLAPARLGELGEEEAEQEINATFQSLSTQVLSPILSQLREQQRIYLSPDSVLWVVPWNALPLADGRYAIEEYDFRLIVSGRDRLAVKSATTPSRPIMFADPNYDLLPAEILDATTQLFRRAPQRTSRSTATGSFALGMASRLPGTKAEAEAIRPQLEIWAGNQATVYSDQWALEAVYKVLKQPKVLVVSTHGFFRNSAVSDNDASSSTASNPLLQCGLLFAGCNHPADTSSGELEDGILTGLEIVSTDLRGTELVVLSACETGLGEIRTGEGVAGLRQAFQLAGAQAVISTLWQIPDRETAKLMSAFFSSLSETDDKAASLRKAQLQLIESRRERRGGAHPFFWAAFTITGE